MYNPHNAFGGDEGPGYASNPENSLAMNYQGDMDDGYHHGTIADMYKSSDDENEQEKKDSEFDKIVDEEQKLDYKKKETQDENKFAKKQDNPNIFLNEELMRQQEERHKHKQEGKELTIEEKINEAIEKAKSS